MKSIPYICLAIVSLLLVVSLLTSNGLNRALAAQTNSTAYWKGRYDNGVKRFPNLILEDSVHIGTVEGDAIFWDKNVINH